MIAITKMCIKGNLGIKISPIKNLINKFEYFFGEDQGRYVIEIKKEHKKEIVNLLNENSIHYDELGILIANDLIIDNLTKIRVDELSNIYKEWLIKYMDS